MGDNRMLGRIWRLLAVSARMDLAWLLRDTKYALGWVAADVISNLSAVSGIFLISVRFGGVGGMSSDEILFMMAYSTLVTGLVIMLGGGNNIQVSRLIGRGQLEHLFLQPLSLPVQLLTCGFVPFTGGSNFIVGLVLMAVASGRLGLSVTPGWVLALTAYLLATMAILIARAYLVSSAAFYAPAAAEEISSTVMEKTWFLSTFPLSGMPLPLQVPLVTILPEGLMAWFPSLCLLGRPPMGLGPYYPMLFALTLSLLAGRIFRKGLNHYVKTGSSRYVPYGYRR